MMINLNLPDTEPPNTVDERSFNDLLSDLRMHSSADKKKHHDGVYIFEDVIQELEDFVHRNLIVESDKNGYCGRCLKAHAMHQLKKSGLSKEAIRFMDNIFLCETGHHGYYLDENNLIRI